MAEITADKKILGRKWLVTFYVFGIAIGGLVMDAISDTVSRFIYEVFVVYLGQLAQDPLGWVFNELFGPNPYFTSVIGYTLIIAIAIGVGALLYLPLRKFVRQNMARSVKLLSLLSKNTIVLLSLSVFFFTWMIISLVLFADSFEITFLAAYAITLLEPPSQVGPAFQFLYENQYILSRLGVALPQGAWMTSTFLAFCFSLAAPQSKVRPRKAWEKLIVASGIVLLAFNAVMYSLAKISFF